MTPEQIAATIDHTLLLATSTERDIVRICTEAKQYGFATVCVNPYWVPTAARELAGSPVGVTTVIGFPLGASRTEIKAAEAEDAIRAGATEIDMVLNVGALKSGLNDAVKWDIEQVVQACKGKAAVKVIIETCYLTDEEKRVASQLSKEAGADFVKTSTGFGTGGATVEDIALIRSVVGPEMGIKASGGVRNLEVAGKLIEAGATRLGASSSIAIVTGGTAQGY
ncbi:deoxyribose-phosphate aldolase [Cohnella sp. CIP 111063]|jgi:deoxyribose-phosphate aldolase|uniref:deoxyribose-phosphate aldolase n=1 Tax=unclassified Cohnella TaxID=2636738 RepID=UPI000B8C5FAF|nr:MULTISPECIES: deoxyribose-phosphate aldolase [unclassified Cohnella]OXS57989.1 deoxyribose-phosphate aldolase [Cohnella sp. CIP 111063]PRX71324.1 deoxyribose-phosphate aldolase [Cohnella sp. SGD-V74]